MAFGKKRVFEITTNGKKEESTWNAMAESQEEMNALVQGVFSYVANLITTNIHTEHADPENEIKGALSQILAHAVNQLADMDEADAIEAISEFVRKADMEEYISITESEAEDTAEE